MLKIVPPILAVVCLALTIRVRQLTVVNGKILETQITLAEALLDTLAVAEAYRLRLEALEKGRKGTDIENVPNLSVDQTPHIVRT